MCPQAVDGITENARTGVRFPSRPLNMSHRIDYSKIDVEEFLNDLGLNNVRRDGKEIFFSCPFPGHSNGDLNPSASMQVGTTRVHCFGCGFNGNALTFLAEYENISPLKASRHIREYLGDSFKEPEGSFLNEVNSILAPKQEEKIERNKPLDPKILDHFAIDWHRAWTKGADSPLWQMFDRGFHWQALEDWDIGWDDISRRHTIPWFDEHGALIGFKGRALNDEIGPGHARYKVLGGPEYGFETFDVSMLLFGLHKITYSHDLIIVEGELNAVALDQKGFGPVVAISGKTLSNEQAYILNKMDREFLLYFDETEDAVKAADKLIKNNRVSIMPDHDKDAADSTKDEIEDLISQSESAIMMK